MQQTVLKATFATLETINVLIKNESNPDNSQLIAKSVDSIAMLTHTNAQLSHTQAYVKLKSKLTANSCLAMNMKNAKDMARPMQKMPKIWKMPKKQIKLAMP